jgi:hypothetical protein
VTPTLTQKVESTYESQLLEETIEQENKKTLAERGYAL